MGRAIALRISVSCTSIICGLFECATALYVYVSVLVLLGLCDCLPILLSSMQALPLSQAAEGLAELSLPATHPLMPAPPRSMFHQQ